LQVLGQNTTSSGTSTTNGGVQYRCK
jgi:hypothetical protein